MHCVDNEILECEIILCGFNTKIGFDEVVWVILKIYIDKNDFKGWKCPQAFLF